MKRAPSKLNREWHQANRMPAKATLQQRIDWHLAHQQHCRCREMPAKIAQAISAKGTSRSS